MVPQPNMSKLVSPNDMYDAARKEMLDGNDVHSAEDAAKVMNFFAWNVEKGVAEAACLLIVRIYPELQMHLTDDDVKNIVAYQLARRA